MRRRTRRASRAAPARSSGSAGVDRAARAARSAVDQRRSAPGADVAQLAQRGRQRGERRVQRRRRRRPSAPRRSGSVPRDERGELRPLGSATASTVCARPRIAPASSRRFGALRGAGRGRESRVSAGAPRERAAACPATASPRSVCAPTSASVAQVLAGSPGAARAAPRRASRSCVVCASGIVAPSSSTRRARAAGAEVDEVRALEQGVRAHVARASAWIGMSSIEHQLDAHVVALALDLADRADLDAGDAHVAVDRAQARARCRTPPSSCACSANGFGWAMPSATSDQAATISPMPTSRLPKQRSARVLAAPRPGLRDRVPARAAG